jgi:hypothetical protein
VQERGLIVIFALLQLLHLLRCGLPGLAFLCLNASFMPLLAPGLGIYMFKRVAHAMSLMLAAIWFKLLTLCFAGAQLSLSFSPA